MIWKLFCSPWHGQQGQWQNGRICTSQYFATDALHSSCWISELGRGFHKQKKICENLSLCMLKRGAYLTFLGRGSMNSPMKIIGTRYVGYLSFEGVIRNKKIAKTWKFGTLYAKKRCILYFSEERCINSPQMKIMDTRPVQLLLPPIWTVCLLVPNEALLSWYWLKLP